MRSRSGISLLTVVRHRLMQVLLLANGDRPLTLTLRFQVAAIIETSHLPEIRIEAILISTMPP